MKMQSAASLSLSGRQSQIANLVAAGKSSREIAETLLLSPRTVEHHIEAIFNKLSVGSRVELTAALLGHGRTLAADAPAARPPKTNLPAQRTSLIGRDAEIADIVAILQDSRLVTVTGAGGVGKTRVALAVGDAVLEDTTTGVWLVDLAPLVRGSSVASAVARALSVSESIKESLLETLLAYLKAEPRLLIIDNCEHLIVEVAAFTDALLRGCAPLRILATSRESLRIAGERTYRLPSLRVPTVREALGLDAAAATGYAAMLLFAERARAIDQQFALNDDNAPIVAEICHRLDGIPLAIELAAARMKILSVRALSQKLDQHMRILTGGERTALPRHQTMRALIDWSYDLLSPPEQRLFEQLSIFAGGCTLAAAAAVYTDRAIDEVGVLELLTSLVDKSLVVADLAGLEPRYRLLESTRQYACSKLSARGEEQLIARRHAFAYLELAERLGDLYGAATDRSWRPQVQTELDNWRAAVGWAFTEGRDVVLGQRLVGAMWPLSWRVAPVEDCRWVRAAVELADHTTPQNVVAKLDHAESQLAVRLGDFRTALASADRAMVRYRQLGDELGIARVQYIAGYSLMFLGQTAAALSLLREGLETARRLGRRVLAGFLLSAVASARYYDGDLAGALSDVAEAQAIFTELGDETGEWRVVHQFAEYQFRAGNAEPALRLIADGLAKLRASNDHSASLSNMCAYLIFLARYDEAEDYAREALDVARQQRVAVFVDFALQHLAAAAALRAQHDAERAAEMRIRVARTFGFIDGRLAARGTTREHTEQQEYDRVVGPLRDLFGASKLAKIMASGAAMTEDEATEEALAAAAYRPAGCKL